MPIVGSVKEMDKRIINAFGAIEGYEKYVLEEPRLMTIHNQVFLIRSTSPF